ncbi:MAG: 3-oxoacyl-[acyl-carrier-protein] synthase III C-terminal domain-containing protein [Patescibacteria group bacterium]
MHQRFQVVGTGRVHPRLLEHEVLLALHPRRKESGEIVSTEKAARFIRERLGFKTHAVGYDVDARVMPNEWLDSEMQIRAARIAMDEAGWTPDSVTLLVVLTSTPDYIRFPYQVGLVAKGLGLGNAPGFMSLNFDEGCGGFAHKLEVIKLMGYAGYRRVLVVAGNCYSAFMALDDAEYCFASNLNVSVFGDGAAAVCFQVVDTNDEIGLIAHSSVESYSNPPMEFRFGGCRAPFRPGLTREQTQYVMHGSVVSQYAPQLMAEAYQRLLKTHRFSLNDVKLLIPHQANPNAIVNDLTTPLGIPEDRVWLGGREVGNVAVGCLPFGLDECRKNGRVKQGDLIALVAIGAGNGAWTGGASLIVL